MARRTNVQPLVLDDSSATAPGSQGHNHGHGHSQSQNQNTQYPIESPRTPVTPMTPKSPKSPRSPFRFAAKRPPLDDDKPQTQTHTADPQSRANLPPSLTTPALSSLQQQQQRQQQQQQQQQQRAAGSVTDEKAERGQHQQQPQQQSTRSGFFGNYKASKSSSRLQADNARPATEEGISRDEQNPGTTRKVSAQEPTASGTTVLVSPSSFHRLLLLHFPRLLTIALCCRTSS